MTYEAALAFIHGADKKGKKNGLQNMRVLLDRLGNPQNSYPSAHIAGTNGKGSVCAFLQAALRCAGYRTGLYTSPYLQRYNERMRVDGKPIPDFALAEIAAELSAVVEALCVEGVHPTEFEIGTALAFSYFAKEKVDIAVVEVGVGGRLDPTNVIVPLVCGITSIGLDHVKVLGDTPEAIAYEKAGIAKPGVPLVLSGQTDQAVRQTVRARCEAVEAPFSVSGQYEGSLGLYGAHQKANAAVARNMLLRLPGDLFSVSEQAIQEGFSRVQWPGRLEWLPFSSPLLLDGAHNPQGAQALKEYALSLPGKYTALLFGVMQDKDTIGIIDQCAAFADVVVAVSPDEKRGLAPAEIASAFMTRGIQAVCCATVEEGLRKAGEIAGRHGGRIIAAGSLYLAGQVRTLAGAPECALLDA